MWFFCRSACMFISSLPLWSIEFLICSLLISKDEFQLISDWTFWATHSRHIHSMALPTKCISGTVTHISAESDEWQREGHSAGFVGGCSGEAAPSLCLFQKDLWDPACPLVPFIKACQQEGISKHLKRQRSGMNVTNTAGWPAVSLLPMVKKAFKKAWNLNNRLVTCTMPQFSIQLWKGLLPKPFWTICILQVGHFPSSKFTLL